MKKVVSLIIAVCMFAVIGCGAAATPSKATGTPTAKTDDKAKTPEKK